MMDQLERFLLVASGDELTGRPTVQSRDTATAVIWCSFGVPFRSGELHTPRRDIGEQWPSVAGVDL